MHINTSTHAYLQIYTYRLRILRPNWLNLTVSYTWHNHWIGDDISHGIFNPPWAYMIIIENEFQLKWHFLLPKEY